MTVDLEPTYRVFWRNLRDLISPPKLPPLKLTSKPVPVRPLWAKRREYSLAQTISIAVHVIIALLIIVPFARKIVQPTVQAMQVIDVSPYLSKLPPGKDKAGGGGGGGEHKQQPPTQGQAPEVEHDAYYSALDDTASESEAGCRPDTFGSARPEDSESERSEFRRSAGRHDERVCRKRWRWRNGHAVMAAELAVAAVAVWDRVPVAAQAAARSARGRVEWVTQAAYIALSRNIQKTRARPSFRESWSCK